MIKILLFLLLFISNAHAITTTDYTSGTEDATWEKTDADWATARESIESDTSDETVAPGYVDSTFNGDYVIARSSLVWDTTGITGYIVNVKIILQSPAFVVGSGANMEVGITKDYLEDPPTDYKLKNYQVLRESVDSYTEIAPRKTLGSKGTATFTLYRDSHTYINPYGYTHFGIHHGNDLDNITPSTDEKLIFNSGNSASGKPILRITTCTNCVHILGNTQIFGGQIK